MIEDVEDDVDELPDSYFFKSAEISFDRIDHGKDGVLPSSNLVDLIVTLWEGFHSEEVAGHLQKLDPDESVSLEHFAFVGWYVDKYVSLESAEEAEHLVVWVCKVRLVDL